MGRNRKTRHIKASPDDVFRAFTDSAIAADWMEASGIVDQRGSLDTAGSTYTLVISGPWRFRMRVIRSVPPHVYELEGHGPLGTSYRMTAALTAVGDTTELVVDTEWTLPFGPIGRWIDRRWVEPAAPTEDDRELDRLVDIVTGQEARSPRAVVRGGRRARELDAEVARAQASLLDREVGAWSTRRLRWSGGDTQVIEAGAGEPLLLVHGGMGNAADWAPLMGRLAPTRHVLAVDRPGHGLATTFDYRGVDMWRHAAAFLAEIADALGLETVDVAANSMGGMWAIALGEAYPERVHHLVLVGAPAGSQRAIPPKVGLLAWPVVGSLIGALVRRGTPEGTRSFWKGLIVAHPERLSEEMLRFATLAARRNVGTWLSLLRNFGSVGGVRPRYLIEPHLRRVAAPVTFVWAEHDAFDTPDRGRQLAAATMRPGQVIVIPDAGHLPWIDEPELVARAILSAVSHESTGPRPEREPQPADPVAV